MLILQLSTGIKTVQIKTPKTLAFFIFTEMKVKNHLAKGKK